MRHVGVFINFGGPQAHGHSLAVRLGGTLPIYDNGMMVAPTQPAKFTLRDLVQLLKDIPKPDPAYWDVLDDIQRKQPPLNKSAWER